MAALNDKNPNPAQTKAQTGAQTQTMFVPYCEALLDERRVDVDHLGDLVPFSHTYRCVRLLDGTYEFEVEFNPQISLPQDLHLSHKLGHAA